MLHLVDEDYRKEAEGTNEKDRLIMGTPSDSTCTRQSVLSIESQSLTDVEREYGCTISKSFIRRKHESRQGKKDYLRLLMHLIGFHSDYTASFVLQSSSLQSLTKQMLDPISIP